MTCFLIGENLPPDLAAYLRRKSFRAKAIREVNLKGADDAAVLRFAKREKMAVITCDQEFGRFFYEELGRVSIVILKSKSQKSKNFRKMLDNISKHKILESISPSGMLVIVSDKKVRMREYKRS